MMVPCYECPDRHEKCHSECYKYIAFKDQLEYRNQIAREHREYYGYTKRVIDKRLKEKEKLGKIK